jgi:hypothetical protein
MQVCDMCDIVAIMLRGAMSVRKRKWINNGVQKEAWVVNFNDASGKRRLKTFATKKDADVFAGVATAVGSGSIPEPMTRGYRPIEFSAKLPDNGWKKGGARQAVAEAFRAQCPAVEPTTLSVVLHLTAEITRASAIADVDNLLKPAIDALKGLAWMDNTQVCELLVRRIPSRQRRLVMKIWQIPGPVALNHLNALTQAGMM